MTVIETTIGLPEELIKQLDARGGEDNRARTIREILEQWLANEARRQAFLSRAGFVDPGSHPEFESREAVADWVRGLRHEPPLPA